MIGAVGEVDVNGKNGVILHNPDFFLIRTVVLYKEVQFAVLIKVADIAQQIQLSGRSLHTVNRVEYIYDRKNLHVMDKKRSAEITVKIVSHGDIELNRFCNCVETF